MISQLNNEQIDTLLRQELVGHLGCHADGRTYVVPISYAYDGKYIFAHTFEGLKIQMMRKNPSVCFQVDDKKSLDKWRSAIIWGVFEEVLLEEERVEAFNTLMARNLPIISSETMHLGSTWPFTSPNLDSLKGIIFRIRIEEKSGRFEESLKTPYYAT